MENQEIINKAYFILRGVDCIGEKKNVIVSIAAITFFADKNQLSSSGDSRNKSFEKQIYYRIV